MGLLIASVQTALQLHCILCCVSDSHSVSHRIRKEWFLLISDYYNYFSPTERMQK